MQRYNIGMIFIKQKDYKIIYIRNLILCQKKN